MMDQLIEWDKELFLFLNGLHAAWLDPVMLAITQTYVWVPLYLLLLFFVIKDHKNNSWTILLGILIAILLADQITSSILKPYFERLRPSREPDLQDLVHLVDGYKGGLYGFASSHAANTFATATFFWMLFRQKRNWIILLFLWASVMTYSRIYLGVHYPGDILVGMLIGIMAAIAGFNFYKWLDKTAGKLLAQSDSA